jgi:hypothetical protein
MTNLITKANKIFEAYENNSIVYNKKILCAMKKELKAAGFKKVFILSAGWGFDEYIVAYSSNDPRESTIVEIGTLKNDNEHYIKIS